MALYDAGTQIHIDPAIIASNQVLSLLCVRARARALGAGRPTAPPRVPCSGGRQSSSCPRLLDFGTGAFSPVLMLGGLCLNESHVLRLPTACGWPAALRPLLLSCGLLLCCCGLRRRFRGLLGTGSVGVRRTYVAVLKKKTVAIYEASVVWVVLLSAVRRRAEKNRQGAPP